MSAHEKVNEMLVDFVLGVLPEEQAYEVKSHLAECRECRSELKRLEALAECTSRIGKLSADEQMCSSARDRIFAAVSGEEKSKTIAWPNIGQPFRWRILMKNPITKLAVAAAVFIACLIGLSFWRGTESGIALADVLARVEKVKAVRYKFHFKVNSDDPNGTSLERHFTELISQEFGMKSTRDELDPNSRESTSIGGNYFSLQKNTWIQINPNQKKYIRTEFDDDWIEELLKRRKNQSDPLRYLRRMQKTKYESLGRSTIDGIEVEGFRTTDSNSLGFGSEYQEFEEKLCVDEKTLLPVRFEQMGYNNKNRTREVLCFYDFQWDVPVDASVFEPAVPDGYTVTVVKVPPGNEETAIQGLRQCVEFFGKYPERITDVYERVKPLLSGNSGGTLPAERLQEAIKGLTEDEIKNKLLMPIRGLERFAFMLGPGWHRKDLAYYGETVTPKDADKILLRWKVSDNEYRVIYGDLRAETVTAEKLAELEATLPK